MDDFNIISLRESRNEWCMRLVNILTPKISEGLMSIFISARKLCMDNNEPEKYLLTFQNLLTRIPQWNPEIIKEETSRILTTGNCKYLEDLITCVHIIQLKILTYVRVGTKHKKIDLNIPKLNDFIHKIYVLIARVIYQKAYLYSLEINTLERQKNNAIVETIIQDCIMNAIRDSIPYELIVRSYLDETDEICEDIREEIIKEKVASSSSTSSSSSSSSLGIPSKELDNKPKIYQSTAPLTDNTKPTVVSNIINDKVALNLINPDSSSLQTLSTSSSSSITNNSVGNLDKTIGSSGGGVSNLDTSSIIYDKLNTLNDNLLLDSSATLIPPPPSPSPSNSVTQTNTSINKDVPFFDDMELSLCEIPTKINDVSSPASLDYIELN